MKMTELFIDTELLSCRYEKGNRQSQLIRSDVSQLEADVNDCIMLLRQSGKDTQADELARMINEIKDTVTNITDVSIFDRYALEKYELMIGRISNILSSLEK